MFDLLCNVDLFEKLPPNYSFLISQTWLSSSSSAERFVTDESEALIKFSSKIWWQEYCQGEREKKICPRFPLKETHRQTDTSLEASDWIIDEPSDFKADISVCTPLKVAKVLRARYFLDLFSTWDLSKRQQQLQQKLTKNPGKEDKERKTTTTTTNKTLQVSTKKDRRN